MIGQLWMGAARLRRRAAGRSARPGEPDRLELVRRSVAGRSFADVGCMWSVDGEVAFAAEAAGASRVSGLDVMAPTPAFAAEHARRGSAVRFVQGDLHDAAVLADLGRHDIVWCSGVIYHCAHPLLSIQRLASITERTLILASETIPEVPGIAQACVFLPGLGERDRAVHRAGRAGHLAGLSTPFDPARGYANWWWGISPSALGAMIGAAGLQVAEIHRGPLHATIVARRP